MAATEKILSKDTVIDKKAFAIVEKYAKQIILGTQSVKSLQESLVKVKQVLNGICLELFQNDLKQGEIYGNHVIETSEGKLTVNFKMAQMADVSSYEETLKEGLKDNYGELFMNKPTIEVTTEYPNQKKQFVEHPELFILSLKKSVMMKDMVKIFAKYPEAFEIVIRDLERYSEVYPNSVKKTKKVYPKNGLLEKLEGISDTLKKKCINTLAKYFDKNMECAIKI
jgi:hypothetical protein